MGAVEIASLRRAPPLVHMNEQRSQGTKKKKENPHFYILISRCAGKLDTRLVRERARAANPLFMGMDGGRDNLL